MIEKYKINSFRPVPRDCAAAEAPQKGTDKGSAEKNATDGGHEGGRGFVHGGYIRRFLLDQGGHGAPLGRPVKRSQLCRTGHGNGQTKGVQGPAALTDDSITRKGHAAINPTDSDNCIS